MSNLVALYAAKKARLTALLDEAWPLEAELNELHRQMQQGPVDRVAAPPKAHGRQARATLRNDITTRRIRLALMNGPLARKGERYETALLVERCEDIPGANTVAVLAVLRTLVAQRLIQRDRTKFWRAA